MSDHTSQPVHPQDNHRGRCKKYIVAGNYNQYAAYVNNKRKDTSNIQDKIAISKRM